MRTHRTIATMSLIGTMLLFQNGSIHARESGETGNELPEHFCQLSPILYSGASPVDQFEALYKKGIRTILSVDGATPKVDEAHKAGLRYVHLPIGYSGVSPRVQASVAKLMEETGAPVYIHCHHGLHRGPTVAALTALHRKIYTQEQALAYLEKAGTGKQYKGLWSAVRTFKGISPDIEPLVLQEISPIDDLTSAMVKVDEVYDYIKLLAKQAAQPQQAGQTNDELSHQSLLLAELFRESARHLSKDQSEMKPQFKKAEKLAIQLRSAIEKKQLNTIPAHVKSLKTSCVECHQDYRN